MGRHRMSKTMVFHVLLLVYGLGGNSLIWESVAQDVPRPISQEGQRELTSKKPSQAVPFAGYEEGLRQSSRWQTMTPEEQAQGLEKIDRARKTFIEKQQQLNARYQDHIKELEKPRESLMRKRRNRQKYEDTDILWSRFQALPIDKRFTLERQLGLDKVVSSQQHHTFQERLGRLPSFKRAHIIRQLQQVSP